MRYAGPTPLGEQGFTLVRPPRQDRKWRLPPGMRLAGVDDVPAMARAGFTESPDGRGAGDSETITGFVIYMMQNRAAVAVVAESNHG